MPNNSDNWCPEVYRSVFIDRHNDNRIRVSPCCQAKQHIELVETFDFNTSHYLTSLRDRFSRGEKPEACARCWRVEELGHKSRRQGAIEFFNVEYGDTTVQLESIDHSATWACNSACIMCNPFNSSLWAKEVNLNKEDLRRLGRLFPKENNFSEKLDVANVKKIHFNGGEPLLNNDQIRLLEKLEQADQLKNVLISYNTNGTVKPTEQLLDFWARTRLVKLFFSIDAIGPAFEYIRYPSKWEQTKDNLLWMREHLPSNVMFGFNITVGCYNVFEMADVWHWVVDNFTSNKEGDLADYCWQFANTFDLKEMPRQAKEDAIKLLEPIEQYRGIINYLQGQLNYNEQSDQWIQELNSIDQRRGTNWRNVLHIGKYY